MKLQHLIAAKLPSDKLFLPSLDPSSYFHIVIQKNLKTLKFLKWILQLFTWVESLGGINASTLVLASIFPGLALEVHLGFVRACGWNIEKKINQIGKFIKSLVHVIWFIWFGGLLSVLIKEIECDSRFFFFGIF